VIYKCGRQRKSVPIHDSTGYEASTVHRQGKTRATWRDAGWDERLVHERDGIRRCKQRRSQENNHQQETGAAHIIPL
jgi:hypothetical protein